MVSGCLGWDGVRVGIMLASRCRSIHFIVLIGWQGSMRFQAAYWRYGERVGSLKSVRTRFLLMILARYFVHGFYKDFNVFGRGVLVDAVPEVEDVSVSVSVACEDVGGFGADGFGRAK